MSPFRLSLGDFLVSSASGDLVPWEAQKQAAEKFTLSYRQVEEEMLKVGFLPLRYARNRESISIENQLRLIQSKVAIVGCGGLGGYVVEGLTRLGVGELLVIDPDVFEEHNLNRQLLVTFKNLGKPKVEVAKVRVGEINPAVRVDAVKRSFTKYNGAKLFENSQVVVDALDSIPVRLDLAEVCKELKVPLVHGAIAGWYGQVAVQYPENNILQKLYGSAGEKVGIESKLGNPAFTPAVVAGLQVAEVCKVLLGLTSSENKRMTLINLLDMEMEKVKL